VTRRAPSQSDVLLGRWRLVPMLHGSPLCPEKKCELSILPSRVGASY